VDPIGYYNAQTASADFYSTTPKVSVTYEIQPDLNTYLTIAKGYKSGGFDLGAVAPKYLPETLWDYEAGVKGDFYDHRLRTSAAVFYYHYTDLQVSLVKDATVFTENAAAARSYGFELETEALVTDSLLVSFSGGYLNAKFTDYTTAGSWDLGTTHRHGAGQ
jgi:iron complex outermembrane receptor protein